MDELEMSRNPMDLLLDVLEVEGLAGRRLANTVNIYVEGNWRATYQINVTYVQDPGILRVEGHIPLQVEATLMTKLLALLNHINDNDKDLGHGRFSYRVKNETIVFTDKIPHLRDDDSEEVDNLENGTHEFDAEDISEALSCAIDQLDAYYYVFQMILMKGVTPEQAYKELNVITFGQN